jgi:transcriptional regulator with GAF, ATPase, and Fis domain
VEHGVDAAVRLARISRELLGLPDEEVALRSIVTKAVEAVDACEFAVVSERSGSRLTTRASTSGIAEACDVLQHRRNEGPCIDVMWNTEVSLVGESAKDSRWPVLGRRMAELGMSSVLAVRLAAGSQMPGSLSLYSSRPDAFDSMAISLAFSFATHAAVALFAARQATGFTHAVETRHTIGVAQGVLMTRYGIDKDRAFQLLRRHSNATNTKLRDVARLVAEEGELPTDRIARQPSDNKVAAPRLTPPLRRPKVVGSG